MAINPRDSGQQFRDPTAAARYARGDVARAGFGPVTELMLDLAEVRAGSSVLDLAAGTGGQTVPAARRVGASGQVLAVDLSEAMLAQAQTAVENAGLGNVRIQVLDAHDLGQLPEASFDAAICRLGLMFMELATVLPLIRRTLKPGGKFAAATWSAPNVEHNPYFARTEGLLRERAGLPSMTATQRARFGLADPDQLDRAFRAAGFRDVSARRVSLTVRHFDSVDLAVAALREGELPKQLEEHLSPADLAQAWQDVSREVEKFAGPAGVDGPGELIVTAGTA